MTDEGTPRKRRRVVGYQVRITELYGPDPDDVHQRDRYTELLDARVVRLNIPALIDVLYHPGDKV